ncbi:Glucosamine-6-phosphate deaminase 1 [Planctomycetes bacterium Pan216]|uniref:Glucosamine-6-phosphate deaminase 1 n=1 Tax=Kolteria novifilia TaxID=2527975 RepID=A0A518BBP2_9BACT|nr:Glucosamine-6-phosphate deaminase 1 [Planctomycetes bacterium Pan216]
MTRKEEIRTLFEMSPDDMRRRAGERLVVCRDIDALHRHFAASIATEIEVNNARGRRTSLILPVGPTGQYPLLAELINERRIGLERCWFFMMDEQCDENGIVLPPEHPLSFRGVLNELFTSRVRPEFAIPPEQLIFPDHRNVHELEGLIESVGGVDTTYGGIGIHGHLAYNEPAPEVRDSNPRLVELNDFTRTINAIRSEIGGNLEGHPRKGITLGMRQLLGAERLRLYCRNGISLDWANTVLRLALFGEPGDDYPVTHIRGHRDYVVVTDEETARVPRYVV